jgi:SAM-dependent methyltransferase
MTTSASQVQGRTSEDRERIRQAVRERYARVAGQDGAGGCCGPDCGCHGGATTDGEPVSLAIGYDQADLGAVPQGADLGLGCGNPTGVASLREGETVLDLGSGGGIDCFLAAERVGPSGHVIGVDMTPEMIQRARRNATSGGYDNVEFRLGEIEALPVADATVDAIVSNCVLNLSPERPRVLAEALRVLRSGGRAIISDLVSDHPAPAELAGNLDAIAACLPTPRETYLGAFREAGFADVRVLDDHPYPAAAILDDPGVRATLVDVSDETRAELDAFARSIRGIVLEARKP